MSEFEAGGGGEETGASAGAADAGLGAASAEGAPAAGGQQQGQVPDFDALFNRFDQSLRSLDERAQALAPAAAAPEIPDPDSPEFFGDEDFAPGGGLTPEAEDRYFWANMDKRIATTARQMAQEMIAPIEAERRAEQRAAEADQLEAQYPELADSAVQDKVIQASIEHAQRLGLPAEMIDDVALSPRMIRIAYLAMKAEEQRGRESGPGTPDVTLEMGGAAGPAGEQGEADLGDRIVAAAQSGRHRVG